MTLPVLHPRDLSRAVGQGGKPTLPSLAELFPDIPFLRQRDQALYAGGIRSSPHEHRHDLEVLQPRLMGRSASARLSPSCHDEALSPAGTRFSSPSDSGVTASTPSSPCSTPHGSELGDAAGGVEFGLYRLGAHGLETLVTDNDKPIDRYRRPAPEDPRRPKKHSCPDCNFRDARLSVLKIHMRRHTGERPFKCEVCSRVYISTSNLYRHRRSCHSAAKGRKTVSSMKPS